MTNLDDFKHKCEELGLELLSDEAVEGRVLVGCKDHGGAWGVSLKELTLKNVFYNCSSCFEIWKKK